MARSRYLAKRIFCVSLCLLIFVSFASAHPGRLRSDGGHADNKNVEGLGYYHYHCGTNYSDHPAHLHPNGVCPYDETVKATTSVKATSTAATTTTVAATTTSTTTTAKATTTAKKTTKATTTKKATTKATTKQATTTAVISADEPAEETRNTSGGFVGFLTLFGGGMVALFVWIRSKQQDIFETISKKFNSLDQKHQCIILVIPAAWLGLIFLFAGAGLFAIFIAMVVFAVLYLLRNRIFKPASPAVHAQVNVANPNSYSYRREIEIIATSIKMVNTTYSLTTFFTRYDTIKGCFERMSAIPECGQNAYRGWQQALDMYPDRLAKVVERCVAEANALQTMRGRANRFEKYIAEIETAHAYNQMIADAIEVQKMYLQALRDECITSE